MQLDLTVASEAEKSAVLAITDEESETFAEQARAHTAEVEKERRELGALLDQGGTQQQKDLLGEFSKRFDALQRIDGELLGLAVENSNLKASALAFGAGADALREMNAALSRLASAHADAADAKQVTALADGAQIAALRIQTLLPPHIAEASEGKMDDLEEQMKRADDEIGRDLEALGALPGLRGNADLAAAASRHTELREIRERILALSRRNTNVRSLSLSLNEKRKAMLDCHEVLGSLEDALREQPLEGPTHGGRFDVR